MTVTGGAAAVTVTVVGGNAGWVAVTVTVVGGNAGWVAVTTMVAGCIGGLVSVTVIGGTVAVTVTVDTGIGSCWYVGAIQDIDRTEESINTTAATRVTLT